jgi:hypothetical protein
MHLLLMDIVFEMERKWLKTYFVCLPLTSLPLCSLANRDNLTAEENTKALLKQLDYFSPF